MRIDLPFQPRIILLHYTAPTVIGGVEVIMGHQARLFAEAGYSAVVIAGRAGDFQASEHSNVVIIPELDSEHPEVVSIQRALDGGKVPDAFYPIREKIKQSLAQTLSSR